jgi:hypothetical protein
VCVRAHVPSWLLMRDGRGVCARACTQLAVDGGMVEKGVPFDITFRLVANKSAEEGLVACAVNSGLLVT